MDDGLDIPEFLRRPLPLTAPAPDTPIKRRARAKKIPYPKDGYKCVGMRANARAKHKERLRCKWERRLKRR